MTLIYNGPIFPEPNYLHIRSENWESKKKILLSILRSDKLVKDDMDGTRVYTDYHHQLDRNLDYYSSDLPTIFENELEIALHELKAFDFKIITSWFENSEKYCCHGIHNHGSVGHSAVCFVEYDEKEHLPTKFLSSSLLPTTHEAMIHVPPNVKEGDIIIFPSNVMHFTDPVVSDKSRLIISWNIRFEFNDYQ